MSPFVFDLETHRIRRPVAAPRPVCIQWCLEEPKHDLDANLGLWSAKSVDAFAATLSSDYVLVGHNVAYDFMVAMAACPDLIELVFRAYEQDRVEDTLLNQKLIDIANGDLEFRKTRGYNLGEVARRYDIEVDKSDPWRLKYALLENVPVEDWPKDAREYALRDVTSVWKIFWAQRAVCEEWERDHGSPILHQGPARARADLALSLASARGVRTSRYRTELVEKFTKREIERMHDLLAQETRPIRGKPTKKCPEGPVKPEPVVRADGSKNTKVVKQIVTELFTAKGAEVPLTDKGEVSCEKDTMILAQALYAKDSTEPAEREGRRLGDLMITYAEYTTANNLLGRVEDLKNGFDLPLQPRYDSLLETGRTSSSKGKRKGEKAEEGALEGIQIQNFPRGYTKEQIELWKKEHPGVPVMGARECIEPRPGCVFVLADYSSAELHTLAQVHLWLFGRSKLADVLNSGVDPHMWFGCEAFGGGFPYEEAIKLKKQKPYEDWRQSAKPIVFGRPGGMGAKKIVTTARKSYNVIFDLVEAKRLIRLYDAMVPELPEYFLHVNGLLGGNATGLMRQLASGRWRGGAGYSAIANSYFQGLAADGALAALYKVQQECYSVRNSALYGFRTVAFVHDEVVLEGPEGRSEEAAHRLQEVMEQEMLVYTPDCPTPAEPVITRVWSKSAKLVKAPDGRIVPWDLAA